MGGDGRTILRGDHAQEYLIPHLQKTEDLFRTALRELDASADCQILPAADLCFPHDVIRIAGGFATGCLVDWRCDVPVVPVDTTVNIDTTSIFWLSDDPSGKVDAPDFDRLRSNIDELSSYEWNFHKGNHFISFMEDVPSGRPALVIHSNEKEFKYQFNGLMPVVGNWFMDDVRIWRHGGRYLRLLVGPKAELFTQIAGELEPYNVLRHRFLASVLLGPTGVDVLNDDHKHHYFMPTSSSVAIGCYLCEPDETVLIFSRAGSDVHFFQPEAGGGNEVRLLNGEERLLVPHGWGKTSTDRASIVYDEELFTVNGLTFEVEPKVTLGIHEGLVVRNFDEDPESENSLFRQMSHHTPGKVVGRMRQLASYSKAGFLRH